MPPNGWEKGLGVRPTALLLALSAALVLYRLGAPPLVGPDEPRYARVAVEMHRAHSWVTPTLRGQPWLEKPPLYYWLAGAFFAPLGETELAARLPSVLAGVFLVGTTALVGARLYGGRAGLHAGFVLATSLLPFAYAHGATMDMLLAATTTAAIGLLALGTLGVAGRLAFPGAWLFMAAATLAKGPLGVLLPGLVLAGHALVTREWRLLHRLLSPVGILLFLLLAGPWHVAISLDQGPAFVDTFLLGHNLERFTSTIHHHPGPFYYYLPVVLAGLFPWSGLVVPALALAAPRRSRADLFLLLWLLVPFAFFSAAGSKLPGYILPCLPPLAVLMGRAAAALADGDAPAWSLRPAALVGLVLGAGVATTPVLLFRMGEPAWRLTVPLAVWGLLVALAFSRRLETDAGGALSLLRVGAAGFLLLLATAAPPLLARRDSGRDLFLPARGREVLVWGAWRTAWMAGYFYNDGNVREVESLGEITGAAAGAPVLVLCGPAERRRLEALAGLTTVVLAEGPRSNVLLRVERRPGAASPS